MIIINHLNIGDEVWCVETHRNHMKRKRLTFTDAEGEVWERYDMPAVTFTIHKKTLTGMIIGEITGTINKDQSSFDGEYYFEHEDGLVYLYPDWSMGEIIEERDWFESEAEADALKEKYEADADK